MKQETTLLDLLSQEEKSCLLAQSSSSQYQRGKVLFERGQSAHSFYVVNKGQVKLIRVTPSGDEKVFKVFLPQGVIAEMAMFMPAQQYPMTAIVEVDSELIEIKKEFLFFFIKQSPELAIKIMAFMSQRISFLMNTIDTLTQVNADQRLVMYLAQLYIKQQPIQQPEQQPEQVSICLPFNKKTLANQICVKPETLSRMLKKLKSKALIIEKGAYWKIPNVNLLCQCVALLPDIFLAQTKYH